MPPQIFQGRTQLIQQETFINQNGTISGQYLQNQISESQNHDSNIPARSRANIPGLNGSLNDLIAAPNNRQVWSSGQQSIFILKNDQQQLQSIQSRYLRNPPGFLSNNQAKNIVPANLGSQPSTSNQQTNDASELSQSSATLSESFIDPNSDHLKMQFYSSVNFHCILSEQPCSKVPSFIDHDSLRAANSHHQAQNQQTAQKNDAAIKDIAASSHDHEENCIKSNNVIYGSSQGLTKMSHSRQSCGACPCTSAPAPAASLFRTVRPSRGQQFLQWVCCLGGEDRGWEVEARVARGNSKVGRQPHAVYGLEVHTMYSKITLKKSYEDFVRIQKVLTQLQNQMVEVRDCETGKLRKIERLGEYLPKLPVFGRSLTSSMLYSSDYQSYKHLSQSHRIKKIKYDLSIYCQQLLILLDILFFHTMHLKSINDAKKLQKLCKKQYQFFIREQMLQLKTFQQMMQHQKHQNTQNSISKEEQLVSGHRLYAIHQGGNQPNISSKTENGIYCWTSPLDLDGSTQREAQLTPSKSHGKDRSALFQSGFKATIAMSSADQQLLDDDDIKPVANSTVYEVQPDTSNKQDKQPNSNSGSEFEAVQWQTDPINKQENFGDSEFEGEENACNSDKIKFNINKIASFEDQVKSGDKSLQSRLQIIPQASSSTNKSSLNEFYIKQFLKQQHSNIEADNIMEVPLSCRNLYQQGSYFNQLSYLNLNGVLVLLNKIDQNSTRHHNLLENYLNKMAQIDLQARVSSKNASRRGGSYVQGQQKFPMQSSDQQKNKLVFPASFKNQLYGQNNLQSINLNDLEPHKIDQSMWAYEILKFFEIPQAFEREKQSARKIEGFIKRIKKMKVKAKFKDLILKIKDMKKDLQDLPRHIMIIIFQYMEENDKLRLMSTSKTFKSCLQSPILWKKIIINNSQQLFKDQVQKLNFRKMIENATQIQILSLKYCKYVNKIVLTMLNQYCNPFTLQELYLDGCEEIHDESFDCLVLKPEEHLAIKIYQLNIINNQNSKKTQQLTNTQKNIHLIQRFSDLRDTNRLNGYSSLLSTAVTAESAFGSHASPDLNGPSPFLTDQHPNENMVEAQDHMQPTSNESNEQPIGQRSVDAGIRQEDQTSNNIQTNQQNSLQNGLTQVNDQKIQQSNHNADDCSLDNVALPEYMTVLQQKYLSLDNIDAFLAIQDPEVLEFFHQTNKQQNREIIEQLHSLNTNSNQQVQQIMQQQNLNAPKLSLSDKHQNDKDQDLNCIQNSQNIFQEKISTENFEEIIEEPQNNSNPFEQNQIFQNRLLEPLFQHLSRGGLRGLKVLSLAECRNVTNEGISKLVELKYINKLNFLGCTKIDDVGAKLVATQFQFLKDIDVGGTNITAEGLRELADRCKHLKNVSIMGCKKVNSSDDQILLRRRINCQGVDDVFRFHLLPELVSSDLPLITRSVLKTRSTLGLNKVYKYLFRRLVSLKVDDLLRTENGQANGANIDEVNNPPEEKIEILCNGRYLKSTLQLKDVKELYWQPPFVDNIPQNQTDELLILHYRRKYSKLEQIEIKYDNQYIKRKKLMLTNQLPKQVFQRPQQFVPKHLAFNCQNVECNKAFELPDQDNGGHIVFGKIYNCMRCGNCFCQSCSNYQINYEKEFGYKGPIRVCKKCRDSLQSTN